MPQVTEESVELRISKAHLQIAGIALTILLSLSTYFLKEVATSFKELSKSVNEFTTYQKTNDQRLNYLEAKLEQHLNKEEKEDLAKRVLILEQLKK